MATLEKRLEVLEQSLREHIEISRVLFELAFGASPANVGRAAEALRILATQSVRPLSDDQRLSMLELRESLLRGSDEGMMAKMRQSPVRPVDD